MKTVSRVILLLVFAAVLVLGLYFYTNQAETEYRGIFVFKDGGMVGNLYQAL
jgi:hypothetical protein